MSKIVTSKQTSEILLNNRNKDKAINALEFLSDLDYKLQTSLGNLFIYSAGEVTLDVGQAANLYIEAIDDLILYPGEVSAASPIASSDISLVIKRFINPSIINGTGVSIQSIDISDLSKVVEPKIIIRSNPTFVNNGVEILPLRTYVTSATNKVNEEARGYRYFLKAGEKIRAEIRNNSAKAVTLFISSSWSVR